MEIMCPRSCSYLMVELGFEPRAVERLQACLCSEALTSGVA